MVTLYTDPRMLEHRPRPGHPERPERLSTILRHLERTGQSRRCDRPLLRPASNEELLRVHSERHLRAIAEISSRGGGQVEADTWLSEGSDHAARLAVGAVIDAVDAVIGGKASRALCLVRPPGHHARPDDPMGFCLYGSVAAGAADAIQRLHVNRVLIIDWDVHHGNGTQEMFYDNPNVGFFSIHRHPFYPGSGSHRETGSNAGLGFTKNLPITFGTSNDEYLTAFRSSLEGFADQIKPELILVSAGYDAHTEDPVGNLGLEIEDFVEMTRIVLGIAKVHANDRLVSVLEGGYNAPILAACVAAHLETLGVEPEES